MFKMPFTLHSFLAPRKPESFPPLPVLPTNASTAPSLFEDLYLEEDIVFDEVFLDIMGLNESAPVPASAPRHVNEPVYIPRSDSIVAPLFMARRKTSLANCLTGNPAAPFELKNMERFRQTRSKSVSAASALYTKQKADLLKPLPNLPSKVPDVPSIEWSTYNVSSTSASGNFTNYSMNRKMSTPNRFLSVNFAGSSCIPIPASPLSPRQSGEASSL